MSIVRCRRRVQPGTPKIDVAVDKDVDGTGAKRPRLFRVMNLVATFVWELSLIAASAPQTRRRQPRRRALKDATRTGVFCRGCLDDDDIFVVVEFGGGERGEMFWESAGTDARQ